MYVILSKSFVICMESSFSKRILLSGAIFGVLLAMAASYSLFSSQSLPFTATSRVGDAGVLGVLYNWLLVVHAPAALASLVVMRYILIPVADLIPSLGVFVWSHWTWFLFVVDLCFSSLFFAGVFGGVSLLAHVVRRRTR